MYKLLPVGRVGVTVVVVVVVAVVVEVRLRALTPKLKSPFDNAIEK